MNTIIVSVIIPFYNAVPLLDRCLNSVFAQISQYSLEVILIDDGSTDSSLEIIKNRTEKNIRLFQQKNSGPAIARNKGIENAQGKYIAFLDADDYWEINFIEETVYFLENQPDAIAVSVAQIHRVFNRSDYYIPKVIINEPTRFVESIVINDFFSFWAEHNHVCTGSALIRTDIAKKTGGQRSDLRITEDLEFWAYLATFGKWGFIPKVLFVSDGGELTRNMGWVSKMKLRWENAPTVENWEKRIIIRLEKPYSKGYLKSRGFISKNLIYSKILSGRTKVAREAVLKYKNDFPKDNFSRLIILSSYTILGWNIMCKFLQYREMNRKV